MQPDTEYRRIVGMNIRRYRTDLRIPQCELARRLGITPSYLHQVELKGKMPTFILAMRIANALQVNPEDLLRRPETPDES